MKQYLLVLLSLAFFDVYSQPKTVFPQDFIGHWKGTLQWNQAGKKEPQQVVMQLIISPVTDSAGQYHWNLVYGDVAKDNRPYVLKPIDSTAGHWVIDERNGIILDQYWIGSRLSGTFTVVNSTILNCYWIENGQLHLEFFSYGAKPIATTGKGNDESPSVDSYAMKGFQKAILNKQ